MLHCGVTVAAAAGKCGLHFWLDKSLVHVDVNALELEDAVQCIQLYKNLKSPAAELGECGICMDSSVQVCTFL